MILIMTIGCSKYSSYDDCFVNEMSKMPDGLSPRNDGVGGSPQRAFRVSVQRLCKEQFPD